MEARQEYEMIKRAEEHYRLVHYKVLGFISKLQGLAQALEALWLRGGDPNGDVDEGVIERKYPVNSRPGICMIHMDDKGADKLPKRPRSSTSVDPLISISINGITDVSERLTATALHASCSFHDTDVVIQTLILDVLTRSNGQQILVIVFDQGPLNYNGAVAYALPVLLVQLGLFSIVVVIFLQLYLSKGPSDRAFGVISNAVSKESCLSKTHLGQIIERLYSNKDTKARMRFNVLNPYALNKFKEGILPERFSLTSTGAVPTAVHLKEMQQHIFVASGTEAQAVVDNTPAMDVFVGEAPVSLQELLGRFISPPGWVTTAFTPDSSLVSGLYMLKKNPMYWSPREFKFDAGISLVGDRRHGKKSSKSSLKENDNALKFFGFNAWRKRHSTWKTEVQDAQNAGYSLYRTGYSEEQCTGFDWIEMSASSLSALGVPPINEVRAMGLVPNIVGQVERPLVSLDDQGQSLADEFQLYSERTALLNNPMTRCSVMDALDYITEQNDRLSSSRSPPGSDWDWEWNMKDANYRYLQTTLEDIDYPPKPTTMADLFKADLLKENPEVTAEEVTRKWKQLYKEHGDYGMQYEEGAEKMKIAYQRKHELWLEQHNSKYQIPPWALGYFFKAVRCSASSTLMDTGTAALEAGVLAALKTTLEGSAEEIAFKNLLCLVKNDSSEALQIVVNALSSTKTATCHHPSR